MKMHRKTKRLLSVVLAVIFIFSGCLTTDGDALAKADNTGDVYAAIRSAYASEFPLTDNNMIHTERTNIFGNYSTVLGVSAKYFSEYTAAQKSNSQEEYMCFICRGVSAKAVKKIKKQMKKYVINEYKSNLSYHSEVGKELLKKAKVGSKGKYVYLFVLDTAGNSKAINAFKESLS